MSTAEHDAVVVDSQDPTEFRSRYGLLLSGGVATICVAYFVATLVGESVHAALRMAPVDLAVIWSGWMIFGYPRIRLEPDDLVLVNVFRVVRIPWSSVREVQPQMMMTVYAGAAKYKAWTAPGASQAGSLAMVAADESIRLHTISTATDTTFIKTMSADQNSRVSDAAVAADLVRTAWKRYEAGHPTATPTAVVQELNTRPLCVLGLLALTAAIVLATVK